MEVMEDAMRKNIILSISILFLSSLLISQNVKIGEVNYYDGSAKICREIEGTVKCEFVRFGMSIFKDDRIITSEGRVEIDFGNNDFLRVDKDSEVIFRMEEKNPNIEVKKGKIYLSTVSKEKYKILSRKNLLEISTPGKYRIESGDKTSISVIKGFAEVTFSDGSFTTLEKGEMAEEKNGKILRGFSATYDSFDRFVQKRDRIFEVPSKEREVAYYPPYWYYEPYWMWSYYYYWLPYSFWYYPSFYYGYWPYYWYYIPYREVPYFRSENWRNVLSKETQVYKGGNPPSHSPIRYKYTSTFSKSSSHYGGSGSSSYQGSISKSTLSSSSSSSSSSGSSGHAKPKDK
jgi:hypothetical protein